MEVRGFRKECDIVRTSWRHEAAVIGDLRVANLDEHIVNQRSTVGWKLNKVAKILEESYMVRIESAASFGASAEAN